MKRFELGLALAGGAARCFAHLGVLRALTERHLKPDMIAGTSGGALMAALWLAGWKEDEIREAVERFAPFQPWKFTYTRPGLFDFRYFRHYWSRYLPDTFEELDGRLTVVATDLETASPVFFDSGPLEPAISASCSMPPLFEAIEIEGRWYFDGGLVMNLPTGVLRNVCNVVVGVEVNPHRRVEAEVRHSTWGLFSRGMEAVFRASPRDLTASRTS
ncbi:MAG: phospholipase [Myxococcales bacterium]|nr:phospholipase [Myxococcales bacterium]